MRPPRRSGAGTAPVVPGGQPIAPPTPPGRSSDKLELQGSVWLAVGGRSLGGEARIALLRAIDATGSITHAAKAVGLSYKAAWDAVDTMNNLSPAPLVERSAGGHGGGGTRLTERGRRLVGRYAEIEALHRRFVELLGASSTDLASDIQLLRTLNMKTSARNQFAGRVTALTPGAVNDEVELTLSGGQRIVAVVTQGSTASLGLGVGVEAFALVKASSVIVATELGSGRLSARNQLVGSIAAVRPGAVNAEVVIELGGGSSIAAIVTQQSVGALGLAPGVEAAAIFKASSVIVGTPA